MYVLKHTYIYSTIETLSYVWVETYVHIFVHWYHTWTDLTLKSSDRVPVLYIRRAGGHVLSYKKSIYLTGGKFLVKEIYPQEVCLASYI